MAEEEVLFENSPLQKYLDEIGFSDFERVSSCKEQEESEESRISSFKAWIRGLFHRKAFTWESSLSRLVLTPSKQDLEAFRKDYIAAVADSDILTEDDFIFLTHFDPELFKLGKPCKPGESHNGRNLSLVSEGHFFPCFVVFVSVLLASFTDFVCSSLSVALIILFVAGIKSLSQYYFSIYHQRNVGMLTSFTVQIKRLALLLRKSIKLIQEMELLSKGYTMVGPAIPLFLESKQDLTRSVYPKLRKTVMENTEDVIAGLQKSSKELLLRFPLGTELDGMFTYLSTGTESITSGNCTEGLSLQSMKAMTSLVFSLQSEFLSRFLLCMSVEANDGNLYKLYMKLFKKINKIFEISTKVITTSLKSIERSYHMHRSYYFVNEEPAVKHPTRLCNKWTPLGAALHSLQLHLQSGILRVQSLQQIMSKVSSTEKEKNLNPTDLETTFQWLKIDLELALSCWKESEKSLDKLLGRETLEQPNHQTTNTVNVVSLEESTETCALDLNEEDTESDRVYEAFSDPYDEAFYTTSGLTAEELKRENNSIRENKQLLQELKAVLFTKTKDPLISTAGFVQPVKAPGLFQKDTVQVNDGVPCNVNESANSEKTSVETSNASKLNNELCEHKQLKHIEGFSQLPDKGARPQPKLFTDIQSSVAVSAAAAAVMRSKTLGLSEENFIADDSD